LLITWVGAFKQKYIIIIIIIIIIFINCNWVVTRWQYTFTPRQYTDNTNNKRNKIATNVEECGPCPVFASFLPWHLPYN
jgi:uncharacterized ion transporter superfamily protein YfcC